MVGCKKWKLGNLLNQHAMNIKKVIWASLSTVFFCYACGTEDPMPRFSIESVTFFGDVSQIVVPANLATSSEQRIAFIPYLAEVIHQRLLYHRDSVFVKPQLPVEIGALKGKFSLQDSQVVVTKTFHRSDGTTASDDAYQVSYNDEKQYLEYFNKACFFCPPQWVIVTWAWQSSDRTSGQLFQQTLGDVYTTLWKRTGDDLRIRFLDTYDGWNFELVFHTKTGGGTYTDFARTFADPNYVVEWNREGHGTWTDFYWGTAGIF